MKRSLLIALILGIVAPVAWAQTNTVTLYKVYTDRENNNCKTVQFVERDLSRVECLDKKDLNIEIDDSIQQDYLEQAARIDTRLYMIGPYQGQTRWNYVCISESAFDEWYANATKCQ